MPEQYCYVENGNVVSGPGGLPNSDKRRSNLQHASADELVSYGWLPVTLNTVPYNKLTHGLGPENIVVLPAEVIITDTIVALDQETVDAKVSAMREQLSVDIKAEARKRIIAIVPDWKQNNLNARMNELNKKVAIDGGTLDQAELDDITAMDAIWAAAKNIRAKSDILEGLVDGMTAAQLDVLDVTDNSHWV